MIQTIRKAWGIPELRKKIIFTIMILLIFRLGNAIPVPYVNTDLLQTYLDGMSTTVLGLYNVMSGGAFAQATVFALGVQPYINSSIIIQLLTIAIPALERLARDGGEAGKKKIASITRYATVAIALLQGLGYYMLMRNYSILEQSGFGVALVIIISFVAGSAFVMWLGEQVNEFGVGNGISIILFAGIVSRVPTMVSAARSYILTAENTGLAWLYMFLLLAGMLLLIILIVHVSAAERRIPVQYAKRQVGRKMYGGQASTLPMKVNMSGVLPIIFAQSIASLPATIAAFLPAPAEGSFGAAFLNAIDTKSVLYLFVYFLMIIGFSYFYATIQFNPVEISNNLKRQGGFIPGFRPGKPTSDFIAKVLSKVTLFGAIYLGIVAIAPLIVGKAINNNALAIGGTSVIIVVGVALETVQALENQMLMRQYKGFLE
ncbi:MAG: preprotein translocase subunit SecY [Oscillospiraceae bacterium]|nr:preprotein translocase subunit SecY [Oscillospiraceae bacterium]MBR7074964.1 preprotein translocase subunit SecY [Oscillospiraceae bacterium]